MRSKRVKRLKAINMKKRIKSLLLVFVLLFTMTFNSYMPKADENKGTVTVTQGTANGGNISVTKTAMKVVDVEDQYKITFDVKGKPGVPSKKEADIVIIVDTSGSMEDKINIVKKSVKSFCSTILDKSQADIKIGLVKFSCSKSTDVYGDKSDGQIACDFVGRGSKDTILNAIDNLAAGSGTNTEAGINKAGEMLYDSASKRPNADKYVVLFTDGLPTASYTSHVYSSFEVERVNGEYGKQEAFYDEYFKDAQKRYNELVGGIQTLGGIGYYDTGETYSFWWELWKKYKVIARPAIPETLPSCPKGNINNVKFYSCGLFTDPKANETEMAIRFLSTIQNVMNRRDYGSDNAFREAFKEKYYTNDKNHIESIFNEISGGIINEINNKIGSKVQIIDPIAENFIIKNKDNISLEVEINGKRFTGEAARNIIEIDAVSKTVTLNLGDLMEAGAKISFTIEGKDSYFSGNDVPTNKVASLKYIDPISKSPNVINIDSPKVDICPKIGSITIEKEVIDNKNNKITDSKERFSILLQRLGDKSERYGLELVGNSIKTMKFYMKGETTDVKAINNATDKNLNYITVGSYIGDEIVPMNYKCSSILYKYSNGGQWTTLPQGQGIQIDKDHPNVYIKFTNNLINDKYWWDSEIKSNTFTLVK